VSEVLSATAEAYTAHLARELLAVRARECVICYAWRMLRQFGCDNTLRFAVRWRDQRLRSATGLERRLARRGACCCDCEIFMNAYTLREDLCRWDPVAEDYDWPPTQPGCAGVRSTSSQPCALWVPLRRW
jgi:hypothetical protein